MGDGYHDMDALGTEFWLAVTGACLLLFVLFNYGSFRALVRRGTTTVGHVVGHQEDSDHAQALVVVFADRTGRRHRITSRAAMTHWGYRRSRQVTVAYDPRAPERARIWEDVRLQSLVGVALGLLFLGLAAAKALGA